MGAPTSYILQGESPGSNVPNPLSTASQHAGAEALFSFGGLISASSSGRYYTGTEVTVIASIVASLRLAGSTSTVVQVKRNDVIIATLTLGSGQTLVVQPDPFAISLVPNVDYLSVTTTAAGTGASDLDVQVRF